MYPPSMITHQTALRDPPLLVPYPELGQGYYKIRNSDGDGQYVTNSVTCTCVGFAYRHSCRHITLVQRHEQEKRAAEERKRRPRSSRWQKAVAHSVLVPTTPQGLALYNRIMQAAQARDLRDTARMIDELGQQSAIRELTTAQAAVLANWQRQEAQEQQEVA